MCCRPQFETHNKVKPNKFHICKFACTDNVGLQVNKRFPHKNVRNNRTESEDWVLASYASYPNTFDIKDDVWVSYELFQYMNKI